MSPGFFWPSIMWIINGSLAFWACCEFLSLLIQECASTSQFENQLGFVVGYVINNNKWIHLAQMSFVNVSSQGAFKMFSWVCRRSFQQQIDHIYASYCTIAPKSYVVLPL